MTTLVTPGVVSPSSTYPREPYHCSTDNEDNRFIPINQNHNGCDDRRDMEEDEEINKEEEDDEEEDEEDKKTVNSEDTSDITGQRVKNKRKNFQPRSIMSEMPDDGERFERNRRKAAATPQKCVKAAEAMDLSLRDSNEESDSDGSESSKTTANLKNYRRVKVSQEEDASDKPRNLLILLSGDKGRLNNPFGIDISKFNRSMPHHPGSVSGFLDASRKSEIGDAPLPQPGEANALKEYAENTMRELLSIYGPSTTEMAEPITKNLDISHFSAGKILEKCETIRGSRHPCSPLSQPPTPPHTPLSPFNLKTRRAESPIPDDEPETDSMVYFRQRMSLDTGTPRPGSARVMFPDSTSHLSSLEGSKDRDDDDSPPPSHRPTIIVEPRHGPRLLSSPTRDKGVISLDYSKYVKRYSSSADCSSPYCKDLNYREHFHCLDCTERVFVKKEEMIRHFKWHKKRDESLQHGFLRYSPMDDCSDKYRNCQHNRKQTHYHCVHDTCDKTYISTSDVQMHANYHRKDSAIIQEGFQRFRATEECQTAYCAFYGQRTTHFHCRRDNCQYTFKNKADMEKHKSYHIKDEQLSRDGFKKFMKNEACGFENCRFSRISNHIHCIRTNCSYVLHSSGQLLSHKRKHERKDSELAYRKFKLTQTVMRSLQEGVPLNLEQLEAAALDHSQTSNGDYSSDGGPSSPPILPPGFHRFGIPSNYDSLPQPHFMLQPPNLQALQKMQMENLQKLQEMEGSPKYPSQKPQGEQEGVDRASYQMTLDLMEKFPELMLKSPELFQKLPELLQQRLPAETRTQPQGKLEDRSSMGSSEAGDIGPMDLSNDKNDSRLSDSRLFGDPEEVWSKYLRPFSANEVCIDGNSCEDTGKDHFHCVAEGCRIVFRTKDAVREHGRNHAEQDRVTEAHFATVGDSVCQFEGDCDLNTKHYHCIWEGCREVLLPNDSPFLRLDHIRQHETSKRHSGGLPTPHLATSLDAMFRRKRGRPPKNRIIEVWNDNNNQNGPPGISRDSPQAIFTSFKLPKPSLSFNRPPGSTGPSAVDLTQEQPSSPTTDNNSRGSSPVQLEGFITQDGDSCPEQRCSYTGQHLHCAHPRCIFATAQTTQVALHREFHERVDILPLFVCYDRTSDCRSHACLHRTDKEGVMSITFLMVREPSSANKRTSYCRSHACLHNKNARHFHCMRTGCNFSFLRPSTMALHDGNHARHGEGEIPLTRELEHEQGVEGDVEIKAEPASPGSLSPAKTTVKASGTFYPLSSFHPEDSSKSGTKASPRAVQQSPENLSRKEDPMELKIKPVSPSKLYPSPHNFILSPNFGDPRSSESESQNPLSKLMRLQNEAVRNIRDLDRQKREREPSPRDALPKYMALEQHVRYGPTENCSRPFCKLKRKEHFHCNACNQAFSEVDRLRHHIARHSSGAMSPGLKREPEDNNNDETSDDTSTSTPLSHGLHNYEFDGTNPFAHPFGGFPLPPSLNAAALAQHIMQGQGMLFQQSALYSNPAAAGLMFGAHGLHPHHPLANGLHPAMLDMEQAQAMHQHLTSLSLAAAPSKRSHSPTPLADLSQEAKKARVQNSMRILKDEPVPEGYIRFRFNEDCKYPHCGYREHQTHFHCMRKDCGYSFCDKTRFVQHTARHERLDTLMGGDFQQYRANVSCARPDCVYASSLGGVQNKASHFHCIKCNFVCTDTNKVVAHRRQHQKLDSINAAGFEKYTPSQICNNEGCTHSGKQTHYHCLSCQYAVLGLSQMSAHKYRHME